MSAGVPVWCAQRKGNKTMANQRVWRRSISVVTALILLLATIFSISSFMIKDAAEQISDSIIKLTDKNINKNTSKFFDSSAMYKLPDTVKDTDDISVIIQIKGNSLLDVYEAGDRALSFSEFVSTDEAELVKENLLSVKNSLLADIDSTSINYDLGADYKAIFGGFEMLIKAGDLKRFAKLLATALK